MTEIQSTHIPPIERKIYPVATTARRPADVAAPRKDGCPACVATRDNEPFDVGYGNTGYYASYRCWKCGATWWTGWAYEPSRDA